MVDEILKHIHHLWRDVVEGDGRITAACSSIGLRDENTNSFFFNELMFICENLILPYQYLTMVSIDG